jgi:LysR family transcriptional regulator, regulator for metE and metH
MNFRELELFLAVMEHSSVTKAAEKVNLSPGAVSLQLHNLAADLHTDLFVKSGKHLAPTPAALGLAEKAKVLISGLRDIEHEFANDPLADHRPFHFATGATSLIHKLGKPLRMLRKQYPGTSIRVTVSPTEETVAGLLNRTFDLALISLPFPGENLTVLPLYEEEMLILRPAPKSVRGWHVGALKPADLDSAPFILYPKRSNMRAMIDDFFRDIGAIPRVTMEADDTEVIKKLVESGFGSSVLPEYALRKQPKFFHLFRVPGHKLVRRQALAMARSDHPRALTRSIAKFLHALLTGG